MCVYCKFYLHLLIMCVYCKFDLNYTIEYKNCIIVLLNKKIDFGQREYNTLLY